MNLTRLRPFGSAGSRCPAGRGCSSQRAVVVSGAATPAFRRSGHAARQRHWPTHVCRAQSEQLDLEAQVEAFMKKQAEMESGAAFAGTVQRDGPIGTEVVDNETARTYCREVFEALKQLKANRDMSVGEVKLVIQIEDPNLKEARKVGIEDERGVSRDEMATALLEVAEGRIPKDRLALKCLWEEIMQWPFLDAPPPKNGKEAYEDGLV